MRNVSIPLLLFVTYACAAQPRLSTNQLRLSLLHGNSLRIAEGQHLSVATVPICLATDPDRLIVEAAEKVTNEMFAQIRVRLQWHEPPVCPAGAADPVFLALQIHTPDAQFPGALGVALPLEGSHAWVFYDRVSRTHANRSYVAALLAHVMAHEIAHVLQGVIRHSDSGILKAEWSGTDCARLAFFPLMFTPEDAILIRHGLEKRRAGLVLRGSGGAPSNRSDEIWARGENSLAVP